jgi:hypothetical protein
VPTSLVAIVGAAVFAAGGVGVGSMVSASGGVSKTPAATVPALAADPTAPPPHRGYEYQAPAGTQQAVPGSGSIQGQAPGGGAPTEGLGYAPKGLPSAPLKRVPAAIATPQATTWPLYLSGGDQLQPDRGAANGTDQSIGPAFGGACGLGLAGRWTAPTTADFPFHGTVPGLLHVATSGSATLTISLTSSVYGGSCSVLSSTTVTVSGTQAVAFTLPRVDVDLPAGLNVSLVVATNGSAHILSSAGALSYFVAPTPPH